MATPYFFHHDFWSERHFIQKLEEECDNLFSQAKARKAKN
jgi:hypothetical protein